MPADTASTPRSDAPLLEQHSLPAIASNTRVPSYDRSELRPSIIHIGVGGFHRAHLAEYIHELCEAGNTDWAIVGAGVRPPDRAMADALRSQDFLYTLIAKGPAGTDIGVIGSIVDFELAAHDPTGLIDRIADPSTQIVSLTITEGGYPIDNDGTYAPESPVAGPGSAFDIIARALIDRRDRGVGGLTIMSCDNILSNGSAARASTMGEAGRVDPTITDWIASNVTFPNSMVDRITPATDDADRDALSNARGYIDQWPVITEPFRQWVIEDRFAGDRPPLEQLDVIVTDDVEPYELMKLRLLNAGHSCIAYLAALSGIETVDAAMANDHVMRFLDAFLRIEALDAVPDVPGIDLDVYIDSLLERFSNEQVGDQIERLCLDGSAKLPKFLIPTIEHRLRSERDVHLSALAVAGWCEYLRTRSASDVAPAADPNLAEAIRHAEASWDRPERFLKFVSVFGDDLPTDQAFVRAFSDSVTDLRNGGVPLAIDAALHRTTDDRPGT